MIAVTTGCFHKLTDAAQILPLSINISIMLIVIIAIACPPLNLSRVLP